MVFQEKNSNYCNDNCIHKISCRYILRSLLDDLGIYVLNSLTLPNLNFSLEEYMLSKRSECNLYIAEINQKIYEKQFEQIVTDIVPVLEQNNFWKPRKIYHCKGDVFDIKTKHELNFVWLDLCGYFTQRTFEGLSNLLNNNKFDDRGIFAITLMSARQNKQTQKFYSRLQKTYLDSYLTSLKNFHNVQLPKILEKQLMQHTGLKITLAANYSYKPSSGGGTMSMYAFEWERE